MINYIIGIAYIIGTLFGILSLIQTYRTIRIYYIYKKRYGDQVKVLFFPILGLVYFMNQSLKNHDDGAYFMKKICRENPKVKAIIILSGLFNYFIAIDNEWIKFLSQDQDQFYKNDGCYAYSKLFQDSLFFNIKYAWKRQRQLLNSSFHYEALKNRVPIIKEEAKNFCSHLKSGQDFVKLNIFEEVQKITSEVLARSFFNREFKNQFCKNGKQLSLEITDITQETYLYRISSSYFILKSSFLGNTGASFILNSPIEKNFLKRMDDILVRIEKNVDLSIQEVISSGIEISKFEPRNFIEVYVKEYLIQQRNIDNFKVEDRITKKEIIQQFILFFFAGTDTTAHLISMTLYALANNTLVYEKLLNEINENVPSYNEFNHSNLLKLSYLDAVIKESTRLYPAGPFVFPRRLSQDYLREDLYLSKDLNIMYRISQFSEANEAFTNSDSFIPERFLGSKTINPYDMLPFSAGSRNCIGQHMAILEAKYIIIYILQNFDVIKVPNYKLRMIQKAVNDPLDKQLIQLKRK